MLIQLSIRNVVLIEKLDLTFDQGLTVFTGETGAGKSILLDSLALTLGERASSSLIRTGSNQASVTACFEIEKTHPAYQQLAKLIINGLKQQPNLPLLKKILKKHYMKKNGYENQLRN